MENSLDGEAELWHSNPIGYFKMDDLNHNSGFLYGQGSTEGLGFDPPEFTMPSHLFTPPDHDHDHEQQSKSEVSVSSSFFPGSHNSISDTIFRSSDGVLFYVTAKVLLECCKTIFQEFLGASISEKQFRDAIIDIPESSAVLNIIIHTIYGISVAKHSPSYSDIETAVDRMLAYGLVPKIHMQPSTPLFDILLSQAPLYPIKVYSLAGHFDVEQLAIGASAHLLSYDLSDLTDDLAKRMGPKYLRRLMILHYNLKETLKATILQPPQPHPPRRDCNFEEQKKLSRAWALAASYLAWDSRPDLSIHTMQATFSALGDHLDCEECTKMLRGRIKEIVLKWVNVKRTI